MNVFVRTKSAAGHEVDLVITPIRGSNVHDVKFTKRFRGAGYGTQQYIVDVLLTEGHVCAFLAEFFATDFTPLATHNSLINNRVKEFYNDTGI